MPICYRLESRSWQWRLDLVRHEAVCSSECTCSWESINVKTVNYFTVHQSMSEKREFVLWRGVQSTVSDSSFLCHEFMGLGSILYLFFFPDFRSSAALCKASGRICFCCNEGRFQTPLLDLLPTWVRTQTCAAPQETHICSWTAVHLW